MSEFKLQGPIGSLVKINERMCTYFGGTSYYCLHSSQELITAAINAMSTNGVGTASSRFGQGSTSMLAEIERTAARFLDCEDAVYLASGFLTGVAALQSIADSTGIIFADKETHFSNIVAARVADKPILFFSHLDASHLDQIMSDNLCEGKSPLILTDGIFPKFGEIAPIPDYLAIARKFDGKIWIDDAHAIGVLGSNGRGTCDHFGIESNRIHYGSSLAKAVGGFGGVVAGASDFIDKIKTGPVAVTASVPSVADIAASVTGLNILMDYPEMRERLRHNTAYLKAAFRDIGIDTDNSDVPIVAWTLDNIDDMISLRDALFENGVFIQFVQHYGQADFGSVLRVCVFSEHTFEQIDQLVAEIGSRLK